MRRGLGRGLGMGYKNLVPIDSHIHSLSARGVKSFFLNDMIYNEKGENVWIPSKLNAKVKVCKECGSTKIVDMGKGHSSYCNDCGLCQNKRLAKKDYEEEIREIEEYEESDLYAKGKKSLVVPKVSGVIYHKGIYSKTMTDSEKQKAEKEITKLKYDINNLLYTVKEYKGDEVKDHELLEITILKEKLPHFDFLVSHTDIDATGYFKDDVLKVDFDNEKNAIIQVEYLDTKSEKVGKALVEKINRLNELEIGESLLYVRTEQLEDTSLPLEEWR